MTPLSLATHGMISGEPLCMLTHGWICEGVTPPPTGGGGISTGRTAQKMPSFDELQEQRYYQQALVEDEELISIIMAAVSRGLI